MHPSTLVTLLTKLVFDEARPTGVHRFLRHPNFPISWLPQMAIGPDQQREDAAYHPATPPDLLVALTGDPVPSIARAATRNSAFPIAHMYRLLAAAGR